MAQVQPAVSPLQERFDGGEVSGRLSGRFTSDLYKKSLRTCKNFEPLPQGSLRMRSGSELIQALTGDARTKLIPIRMSTGEDFLAELLDKKMHLYSVNGGQIAIQTIGVSELVANGDFGLANGSAWLPKFAVINDAHPINVTQVAFKDITGAQCGFGVMYSALADSGVAIMYQRVVVPFAAVAHFQYDVATNASAYTVKISTTDPAGWANETLGGEKLNVTDVAGALWGVDITTMRVPPAQVPPFVHKDHGNVVLPAGVYYISFQTTISGEMLGIDNVSLLATFGAAQIDIPTPWSADEAGAVNYVTETGRNRTIFVHPAHHPNFLLYGGQPGNWTVGDIAFTTIPLGWGDVDSVNVPAGWNWQGQSTKLAQANWPACVEQHDGRIYYAGEPAQQNRIVASASGVPDLFTIGANPGDSLDFKIATKGAIRWLRANRVMLVGTDLGEHSVTGSKGTPLVGDIQARQESAFPSSAVPAVAVGTKALYVSGDLRRLRAAAFDLRTSGWESKDVTFVAEHITTGFVKELHHAWTPDSVEVLLLKNGKGAICTFEPDEQVTAFWNLDLGTATICSCSVTQSPLGAYLWMAILRNGIVYLERLHLSEGSEVLRYLDASIAAVADGAGQVAGLAHLNGSNVRVVVQGGGLLGDFPVIGGNAQLGADAANVAVFAGLPYLAQAKTLPRDVRAGKAQSPKLGVVLNNSALPKLNGKRPADRTPATPMGNAEPLVTGKRTAGNLGWDDEDVITIEQDLPFRTEICALYSVTQTEQSF